MIFLAPDKARLDDLEQAIRNYLAWDSIWKEKETLNLDAFQSNQASTKRKQAEETVQSRIKETYVWLLVPFQSDPQGDIEWQESRLQGQDALAVRAVKRLRNDENLITRFSPTRLRLELDRYLWKGINHLNLKKLWEYFSTYLYLPASGTVRFYYKPSRKGFSKQHGQSTSLMRKGTMRKQNVIWPSGPDN